MDTGSPDLGVDFVINFGDSFGGLKSLDDLIGTTSANAVRDFQRIQASVSNGLDLKDASAQFKALGATATVPAGPDAATRVRSLSTGGCDVVLEMAGSIRALESAVAMTARGGTTVTAGLPPPDAALPVNIVSLVAEERVLKGSYIGTCVPSRDIPRLVSLYRAGRLPVDRLVSGYLTLGSINAAFDDLHAGSAVRQIIRFDA